jgi:hypothetical protein
LSSSRRSDRRIDHAFGAGTFTAAITFAKSPTDPMGTRVNVTRPALSLTRVSLNTSCFASALSNADRARCAAVFFPRSARVAALICAAVSLPPSAPCFASRGYSF